MGAVGERRIRVRGHHREGGIRHVSSTTREVAVGIATPAGERVHLHRHTSARAGRCIVSYRVTKL